MPMRSLHALAVFSHNAFIALARLSMNPLLPSTGTRCEKSPATTALTRSSTSVSIAFSTVSFLHSTTVPERLPCWSMTGVATCWNFWLPIVMWDFVGSGQRVHQLALMRDILVEHVHVDADELLAVKISATPCAVRTSASRSICCMVAFMYMML